MTATVAVRRQQRPPDGVPMYNPRHPAICTRTTDPDPRLVRLQCTGEGAVFTYGLLHLPSGFPLPIAVPSDDWAALEAALAPKETTE